MESDNILDINEVMDDSQNIRSKINPKDGSGWVPNGRWKYTCDNSIQGA